jgi:hypothetical protein
VAERLVLISMTLSAPAAVIEAPGFRVTLRAAIFTSPEAVIGRLRVKVWVALETLLAFPIVTEPASIAKLLEEFKPNWEANGTIETAPEVDMSDAVVPSPTIPPVRIEISAVEVGTSEPSLAPIFRGNVPLVRKLPLELI